MSRYAILLAGSFLIGLAAGMVWHGDFWPTVATIVIACSAWLAFVRWSFA